MDADDQSTQCTAKRPPRSRSRAPRRRHLSDPSQPHRADSVRGELTSPADQPAAPSSEGRPHLRRACLRTDPHGPWTYQCPETGDTIDSEQLITDNLNLARKYAWSWSRKSPIEYAELEAVAYLGLIKGIRRFDPASGYKLSTIAVPYVNGEILHFFRDKGYTVRYPSRWREVMPKARRLLESGEPPQLIAEAIGMTVAELEEMLGSMTGTSELRDEIVGADEPDIELDLLSPLATFREQAWERLSWCDQQQINLWWTANKRRSPLPRLQISSFAQIVKHLLAGRQLPEIRKQLQLNLPEPTTGTLKHTPSKSSRPRSRSRKQLDKAVIQMGLLESSHLAA